MDAPLSTLAPLVRVEGLRHIYPHGEGNALNLLSQIDADIADAIRRRHADVAGALVGSALCLVSDLARAAGAQEGDRSR